MTEPRSVGEVLRWVLSDPWGSLGSRWNYRSAVLSALVRSGVFFGVNLASGPEAALSAMGVEFTFRFATAGFYGALTQAFRAVEPPRAGTVAAMVVLPLVAHSLELTVHWLHGTPQLGASIAASVILTAISTGFNLFAMRRGVLVVGDGCRSLASDLVAIPGLFVVFVGSLARACLRPAP